MVVRGTIVWLAALGCFAVPEWVQGADTTPVVLQMRRRVEVAPGTGRYHTLTTPTPWDPSKTAVVICDMWDKHWCPTATERVAEMAPRMNDVVTRARASGMLIIHCPSDTMEFYKETPQRRRAQQAPAVETRRPLERWCRIDPDREPPLPIDDTDGGCDCGQPIQSHRAWSRQIATIEIHADDAITDSDEAFRLMKSRGIENVVVMGVHTNMCVLGRPFSIRQMVYQGLNVALVRDMTDTMYNPEKKPFVSHFTGNDLVVEHIEKYWCPTITSADFLGGKPFRFSKDQRPHLVVLSAEDEYRTEQTLPEFAARHLGHDFRVSFVFESAKNKYDLPGIGVVDDADVLLISVRRRPLPADQLALVRKFVAAGKPVVGIRTASHAFHLLRGAVPEGLVQWPEIDQELIGGNYQGHTSGSTRGIVRPLPDVKHPILTGIAADEFLSGGTLYLNTPLNPAATELMRGRVEGNAQQEPVAWTFQRRDGGRTFYTSLGHKDDFEQPAFRSLLRNGLLWAAGKEIRPEAPTVSAKDTDWRPLNVPGTWEQDPAWKDRDGFAWYQCQVEVPESWKGRGVFLYVEKVDNACETFLNGVKVGVSGSLPPRYSNGVENQHRYVIPAAALRAGALNTVAIRVFDESGAGGFKGSAPVLIAGSEAITLAGPWLFRATESPALEDLTAKFAELGVEAFSTVAAAPKVSPFATVIRREAQQTPLTPAASMDHFKVPEDLQVDLVLSEPLVTQPLFLNFDERGRMWVMQYRQYPEPAGLRLLSKDQWWRAVYDRVPDPPPHGVKGQDRISIHEDTDGDGNYDVHKVFLDDLNIATAFVQGRGGVWVLNPPYLLFYPDRNSDDVPDGPPEVHLDGFGIEDTHSVINSLRWGPDGWLYGAQGSTVSAAVRVHRPGEDLKEQKPVHSQGQNIWRYHPETRRYEIFSEGGGNAFGVEIDSAGRIFSGHNGGNTRGFHYMQGAYLQKGFSKHGPLSNPYSFGYFPAMEHHNVPRFTHEFLIYEGRGGAFTLPDRYHGKLFGAAAILNHVVISDVIPTGSTFKTRDVGYAIDSSDTWFRPVDVKDGPDGGIYVADWYDGQLAHTANYQGGLDRDNGRIYRIRSRTPGALQRPVDLKSLPSEKLLELLESPDRWHREAARRVLADRRDAGIIPGLRRSLDESRGAGTTLGPESVRRIGRGDGAETRGSSGTAGACVDSAAAGR